MWCPYRSDLPLPEIRKKVVYLDQCFLSSAFRENDQRYAATVRRLSELSANQVIVAPFSSVHEDETHIWRGKADKNHEHLMQFIKQTSGGHEFTRSSVLQRTQLLASFERFLEGQAVGFGVDPDDALPSNTHGWSDYVWIDVGGYIGSPDRVRAAKKASAKSLVAAFPGWRAAQERSFEDEVWRELRGGAHALVELYSDYAAKMVAGDILSAMNCPEKSSVIESMLHVFPKDADINEQFLAIAKFFASEHYKNTPYEWLSACLFVLLKERVRRGDYADPGKAERQLSGFLHDVQHVATYAPYCDAIFVDNAVAGFLRDRRVELEARYRTKVFSAASFDEFNSWLETLDKDLSAWHLAGLREAYPLADPRAVAREKLHRRGE